MTTFHLISGSWEMPSQYWREIIHLILLMRIIYALNEIDLSSENFVEW